MPRTRVAISIASSTIVAPGPDGVPRLVELGGEHAVLVEVARLDRQVGRLERTAALLVDDVEGADEPHVVDEVGDVPGSASAVEVAHEGRAADGAEDEVVAAEQHVALRVPRVQRELARRQRDELLDLARVEPDVARRSIDPGAGPGERIEGAVAEHLEPDLGEDAQRRLMDRLDVVRGQDLDRPVRVHQPPPRQLADGDRLAAGASAGALGLGHRRDATRGPLARTDGSRGPPRGSHVRLRRGRVGCPHAPARHRGRSELVAACSSGCSRTTAMSSSSRPTDGAASRSPRMRPASRGSSSTSACRT